MEALTYLADRALDSVEAWALESGYVYDKHEDIWLDDEGRRTDIEWALEQEIAYMKSN